MTCAIQGCWCGNREHELTEVADAIEAEEAAAKRRQEQMVEDLTLPVDKIIALFVGGIWVAGFLMYALEQL